MPAILDPLQLTSSRQPVLDTGEVMLLIVEKVDLCFEDTGGLVEALAPTYKNGLCFLTNKRLAWVEAQPPPGMQDRSCCVALSCLATAVSSSGTSLVSYPKVRLGLGVDAFGCACLHKERVREEKLKVMCRGRSGSNELKAAIQEQLATAASAAAAKPSASGQESRPGPATGPTPQPPARTQPVAGPPPPETEQPVWPPWAAATPHAASMAVDPAFYGPTTTVSNPLHTPPGASAYPPPAGAPGQFYGQGPGAAYPPAPSQYRRPPPQQQQQQQQLDMPAFTGVSGVMRRQEQAAKKVESDMSQAFQDLTGLINKAGDMVNLAKRLRQELRKPQAAASAGGEGGAEAELLDMQMELQLIDMGIASPVTRDVAGKAYHRELAKQLADFLAAPLEKAGGMMALPDIFCRFNRARGTELVSPDDLLTAIKLFQKVGLQLKLRKFASGVLVVQSANHSDAAVCQRMKQLVLADQGPCVKGITASDVTAQFNVPLTIAREQLLLAEQLGALCRDDGPEGLRFFNNFFLQQAA